MTEHQRKALRLFRSRASTQWARAADFPGVGRKTWDALVRAGYLEQGDERPRMLRLTELGRRETALGSW